MAEPKTKVNSASVADFVNSQVDERVIADCNTLIKMMQKATGHKPKMWGPAIIGFGTYPQKYASGKTQEWPRQAFSPRVGKLTLYVMIPGDTNNIDSLLEKLGKHSTSKACLYIKKLSDVNLDVLQQVMNASVERMNELYPVK